MKVQLVVRYVNGLKDTVIDTESDSAIVKNLPTSYIRQQIRYMHPDLSNKRLKLLHNGRVLMSHTDFTKEISYLSKNLDEDDNSNYNNHESTSLLITEPIKIYFHCIVGDKLSDKELQDEEKLDQQPTKSTTEAPKGFDRLLSQGFSASDIEDLRRQFFRLHGSQLPSNANAEQIRELEDRWIDSSVNHEIDEFPANVRLNLNSSGNTDNNNRDNEQDTTFEMNNNNNSNTNNNNNNNGFGVREQMIRRDTQTHKEMFIGVCVGFALGGLALLLLFMDVGGIFGKRTRMAVICGVIVNVCFGVLKLMG
ncbi:hypothetical protein C6P40_003666 [Pichia californica]|uniref:DSC E3 ubiquitin ligase complex subunit 3 C-terminal domain-containing protein n=1 Tax=Pichia californica TaxID=460514 RepID=A0A9P6WH50_9ASCO|nr:hypothetical protein C6P42_004915 [[Candida] californica]KAG0686639.1 hypothetical protein C6P40_003666 [[Candida] californica]